VKNRRRAVTSAYHFDLYFAHPFWALGVPVLRKNYERQHEFTIHAANGSMQYS
jgi:hypothetical protein